MIVTLLLGSLATLLATALLALVAGRSDRGALLVGTAGALLASGLGLAASVMHLLSGAPAFEQVLPWSLPLGEVRLGLDPLSSFFLLCLFLVSALASLYGAGYLASYAGKKRLAVPAAFLNLLIASMALIITARDAVLFLVAWELMSLASFFLVTFEDEREDVRRAGITYLIASHVGLVFLLAFFGLLMNRAGDFDFASFAALAPDAALSSGLFVLALVGFGTKAGFWPMHVWLPDAHPAAPSHVSALMSGVLIKMGIYGLLRAIGFLGATPLWWGALLVAIGLVSGIVGALHALAQRDLKRLLAYSSVENVGIIALGLGIGLIGRAVGNGPMSFLGFAGALLHVLNHGLFKGLLFQAAGSVLHATGTKQLDSLGALARRMPVTGGAFLLGAVAISGLPPLNGFAGEWLIYLGGFTGTSGNDRVAAVFSVAMLGGLALIGGLAAAAFVRAFGVAFLGEPRSEQATHVHEAGPSMRAAMVLGAAACVVIGVWPEGALPIIAPPAAALAGIEAARAAAFGPVGAISRVALALLASVGALALLRAFLLRGREVRQAPTWGCGYASPTARMQYTAASFSDPILAPFTALLPRHLKIEPVAGYFPKSAQLDEQTGDLAGERLVVPAAKRVVDTLKRVRVIQQGNLHLYLLYILVTLVVLLVWQLVG